MIYHRLNLSDRDVEIVLSALLIAAPVGGGSEVFSLYHRLTTQTGKTATESLQAYMCDNVIDAAVEAEVVIRK